MFVRVSRGVHEYAILFSEALRFALVNGVEDFLFIVYMDLQTDLFQPLG